MTRLACTAVKIRLDPFSSRAHNSIFRENTHEFVEYSTAPPYTANPRTKRTPKEDILSPKTIESTIGSYFFRPELEKKALHGKIDRKCHLAGA